MRQFSTLDECKTAVGNINVLMRSGIPNESDLSAGADPDVLKDTVELRAAVVRSYGIVPDMRVQCARGPDQPV